MELKDFRKCPMLNKLLRNYCSVTYEQNANVAEDFLMQEYELLARNGNLHLLFECEAFSNENYES